MAFRPPTFNITANIWRGPKTFPVSASPDGTCSANLCIGERSLTQTDNDTVAKVYMDLLVPWLTDIRSPIHGGSGDVVEAPAGSGWYFNVVGAYPVGTSFANQHILALLEQAGTWPTFDHGSGGGGGGGGGGGSGWTDSFTDTDSTLLPPHTPTTGTGGYTARNGSCEILSNTLQAASFSGDVCIGDNTAIATFNNGARPSSLSIDFNLNNVFGLDGVVLMTRYDNTTYSSSNSFTVLVTGGTLDIYKVVSGTGTLASSTSLSLTASTTYTLSVTDNGSTITATVGATSTSTTDSTFNTNTYGGVGLYSAMGAADGTFVDNLAVV